MAATDPNAEYHTLAEAFDFLNRQLFAGSLPQPLITLQREQHTRGYYAHAAFVARQDPEAAAETAPAAVGEIALNPEAFTGRTDLEILSTLAHEMCHLWQATFGKPSRSTYHNAEWARKMLEIGLQPQSADGAGKVTGQAMTHSVVVSGPFACAAGRFLAGSRLHWQARPAADAETSAKKRASKTKYTCPACGLNAWAKPDAHLLCADCQEEMAAEVADVERAEPGEEAPARSDP